jgi:flagellar hook-basal body complex protein FliE
VLDIQIGPIGEPVHSYNFARNLPVQPDPAVKTTFESFFNSAMDIVNETNRFNLRAEQLQTDLATGKTDDVLMVLLAQDRAYSSLNFTVQVTNKIIESYREIMRMQM